VASKRTHLRKILAPGLFVLLLCVIVLVQFPELISLNEDTTNDFIIRKANTADLLAAPDACRHLRITDIVAESPALESLFSRLSQFETAAFVPAELSILHSVLRT
jgi:putative cell wall-binding protein